MLYLKHLSHFQNYHWDLYLKSTIRLKYLGVFPYVLSNSNIQQEIKSNIVFKKAMIACLFC